MSIGGICELVMDAWMPIQANRNRPTPTRLARIQGHRKPSYGTPGSSRHAAHSLSTPDTMATENSPAFPPEHDGRVAAKACHEQLEGLKKYKGFEG
jgi:hypothetical protein